MKKSIHHMMGSFRVQNALIAELTLSSCLSVDNGHLGEVICRRNEKYIPSRRNCVKCPGYPEDLDGYDIVDVVDLPRLLHVWGR